MSFADRLKKLPPINLTAERPARSVALSLCMPKVLMVDGVEPQGLVDAELAPMLVGGLSSTRFLEALDEMFTAVEQQPENTELHARAGAELDEAMVLIREHLNSVAAARAQAKAEHEAKHRHGTEPLH